MNSILSPILSPIAVAITQGLYGARRRASAPSVPFNPSQLFAQGELGAWYDPSDMSTMFQDTAGTVPVTADGQTVARINDKSGNGNHATQATAAARPLFRDNGTLRWLQLDGVDDVLSTASSAEIGPPREFWAAVNITTGAAIGTGLFFSGPPSSGWSSANTAGIFQRSDGANRTLRAATRTAAGATNVQDQTSAFVIGTAFVARMTSTLSPDELSISNGGATVSGAATYMAPSGSVPVANIGTSIGSCVFNFYGGLNISRPLTTQEATDLRTWLNAKVGIP